MAVVGIPKEIKDHEHRVAITRAGVEALCAKGHTVLIESGAGVGTGIGDDAYAASGARIVTADEVWAQAGIVTKVKEPQPSECEKIREGQAVFCYFHFAAERKLAEAMLARRAVCIAYETVQTADGSLPLLAPMSDVAGRVAVSAAIKHLERPMGGKGKLISGIPGVRPGTVVVLGGGIAGTSAAKIAAGLGAEVFVLDVNLARLRFLFDTCPPNLHPLASNPYSIREILPAADVVIGTVLVPGGRTPVLVREDMLRLMEPGSVIIDVSVDQGGCVETARPTTHSHPTYVHEGIVHYCVTNMPGAVAHTSTYGLTNATLPYLCDLADKGWERATREDAALGRGLNIARGEVLHAEVRRALG